MSWIQENRFAAGLGGITAVAAAGLIFWGISASSGYNQALEDYKASAAKIDEMEGGKLYPDEDNLSGKEKAVKDYAASVADLQKAFDRFRAPTPPSVDPADFSAALIKARDAAAKAITDAKGEVPAEFFLGFEAYKDSPVKKEATGILTYEMEAISQLVAGLAASGPVKLTNVYRAPLPEEDGKPFDGKGKSYRALPLELSFTAAEPTFRKFLSSLDDSGKYYYVIRSMRISNEKIKAPTAADGVFKTEEGAAAAEGTGASAPPAADPFGGAGGFVLPEDTPATPPAGETPPAAAPEAAPAAAPGDEGAVLQQVMGSEKINAFLRIDIIQFLEAPQTANGAPKAGGPKAGGAQP